MTGIILVLAVISITLSYISNYLMRICNCLENNNENYDDEKGGAE